MSDPMNTPDGDFTSPEQRREVPSAPASPEHISQIPDVTLPAPSADGLAEAIPQRLGNPLQSIQPAMPLRPAMGVVSSDGSSQENAHQVDGTVTSLDEEHAMTFASSAEVLDGLANPSPENKALNDLLMQGMAEEERAAMQLSAEDAID